jgi:hypothetical protein
MEARRRVDWDGRLPARIAAGFQFVISLTHNFQVSNDPHRPKLDIEFLATSMASIQPSPGLY